MKNKRVICAMSGGVDSSVAAALLKKQGYDTIGIFMKLWSEKVDRTDLVRENTCCSTDAAAAARVVADKLSIPFYVINVEKEFKETVVKYYVKEYEAGRTPNPCVICNRDIKGEVLMRKVEELEADFLATGHYARRIAAGNSKSQITNSKQHEEYYLYQANDLTKDQTYFLWTLNQEKLAKMLFPIGDYLKSEVRYLAKKMQLPTAERKESQGICFIPDRDICGFLNRHAQKLTKPGPIITRSGEEIGQHDGLVRYTIGQRERLGLGGPRAYYVLKLDSRNNRLIVGDETDLYCRKLKAENLNWLNPTLIKKGSLSNIGARIRYGHPIDPCSVKIDRLGAEVTFKKAQRAIAPGQSIVFYKTDQGKKFVVGGGVISQSLEGD